jgi:hypothetical protein
VLPFHRLSFGFWFIIMNPGFIPRDNACKKLFALALNMSRKLCYSLHKSAYVHQSAVSASIWNSDILESWMVPCADPTLMFNIVASVHRNLPLLTSKCVHVSSVDVIDGCAQET